LHHVTRDADLLLSRVMNGGRNHRVLTFRIDLGETFDFLARQPRVDSKRL